MADFIHQYALQQYGRMATLSVNTNFGYFSHPYMDVADYFLNETYNGILVLMRAAYGEESQPAIRAEEVWGALQRLRWTLERP